MERHRNTEPRKRASHVDQQAIGDKDSVLLPLPDIAERLNTAESPSANEPTTQYWEGLGDAGVED